MKQNNLFLMFVVYALVPIAAGLGNSGAVHAGSGAVHPDTARVVEFWTPERRAAAIPRDLVIDPRGFGYLRKPDGSLQPYGHQISSETDARQPVPFVKPGSDGGDTTPPTIADMDPAEGAIIGADYTFSATVTDQSAIRSVTFVIRYPDGSTTQSFAASQSPSSDTWTVNLQGFTDGQWSWWVEAKDKGDKGGNTGTSDELSFTVATGGGTPGGGGDTGTDTVTNSVWTDGGVVQTAAGRLYFQMPSNSKLKGPWNGYVCSGTVVYDGETTDGSIILTAAHCVYDDANKAFARNVLFIPDQAWSGTPTDLDCSNDRLGCWVPYFGVVDVEWTNATFPDNIAWDYAYYVVADSGAHTAGATTSSDVLDEAAGALGIDFSLPDVNDNDPGVNSLDFTYALGYSYSEDPNFMYCAEDMTTEGSVNWWLPSCELSGGSSGGPWIQPPEPATAVVDGPIISVNSWGYTTQPGMAGPKLSGTSAECVFIQAQTAEPASTADGQAGVTVVYDANNCTSASP